MRPSGQLYVYGFTPLVVVATHLSPYSGLPAGRTGFALRVARLGVWDGAPRRLGGASLAKGYTGSGVPGAAAVVLPSAASVPYCQAN